MSVARPGFGGGRRAPIRHRTALLVIALAVSVVALAAPPPREFSLGDHGSLALSVPEGWGAEFQPASKQDPPTIALTPRTGANFEVLITVLWPAGSSGLPDDAALRAEVEAAARAAQSSAIEKSLPLRPIGQGLTGYYFQATDRAPAPGEYKHLTQGMARLAKLVLAFTILCNDGQDSVAESALQMIQTASHRPTPAR